MSARKLAAVLVALCSMALLGPAAAGAQTTGSTGIATTSLRSVPLSGTAANGKHFAGHFDVTHFVTRGGANYAVGTLTGSVGHRRVTRSNVSMPVSIDRNGNVTTAAACPVLHLVLGPLDLNLLGLKVHLNQVVLDITAQSGPGNLLGNLLCSVSNLLNGSPLPLQDVSGLLNILQQVLNIPGLLSL